MSRHVIIGAGASGLYTAWRLLRDGTLGDGDTVEVYEWSQRPGGRILSFTFPEPVSGDGLYCEFGGMRFQTDPNFPATTTEGHVMVQNLIVELGLEDRVVPFGKSADRLYYLRGQHVYESQLTDPTLLPYGFSDEFLAFLADRGVQTPYTADAIIGAVAEVFAPGLGGTNADRAAWCRLFASGVVPEGAGTPSFPAGTPVGDIGYWNLLYDQLDDEGYDYAADGNGYSSNVINWNAADAFQNNNDVGSTTNYMRLDGGYGLLFDTLAKEVERLAASFPGSGIFYGQRLTSLDESAPDVTTCVLLDEETGDTSEVVADQLFLAMPRRALEMVAAASPPTATLNDPNVTYLLEASIDQPAIKVVLVFDEAWWTTSACAYPPRLEQPTIQPVPPVSQWVGGPTITDLPLRMIDYFANNVPGGPGGQGGPYVLLASYDDMTFANFWRELEISGTRQVAPSLVRQPLTGPTEVPVDSAMAGILIKQLAEVHGIDVADVPVPRALYFQDWGQDPFGGGYHGWAAHYDVCDVMDRVRAPARSVGSSRSTYIVGSCYSFDQGWVEGALSTAESVLQEFVGLPPLNAAIDDYTLVCRVQTAQGEVA